MLLRNGDWKATPLVKYGVFSSTLSHRERSGFKWQESHTHWQKLNPTMEKALEDWCKKPEYWCKKLDDWGFPFRMDLLRAMVATVVQNNAEEEEEPELAHLGHYWLANFPNCHPSLSVRFSVQLDRQQANAGDICVPKKLLL